MIIERKMKKTYIAPTTRMTEVDVEQLICVSLKGGRADDGSTGLSNERRPRGEEQKEEAWGNLW